MTEPSAETHRENGLQRAGTTACPKVAITVLNWNGWTDTLKCLESVFRSDYPNYTTIVCDNGSDDDSVHRIREWADGRLTVDVSAGDCLRHLLLPPVPKPIPYTQLTRAQAEDETVTLDARVRLFVVQTGGNLGYARGNNVGIRFALRRQADYIFVINNDTIVHPQCITTLANFGENHPDAALMGPKILDPHSLSYTQWAVANSLTFMTILLALSPFRHVVSRTRSFRNFFYLLDSPGDVYAIPGSAMMFTSAALRTVGLFDEATFIYWEEFIMAEKLRQRGLRTFIVPDAVIWHAQHASIGKIGARKFIENLRSERYFFTKYLGLPLWQRGILTGVRLVAYAGKMSADRDYRRNFRGFMRALLSA